MSGASYPYYTADVFTDQVFGGNPVAVVTRAQGLTDGDMQNIAREFNLSETVFVLPPQDAEHHARLRIFTPGAELPFAGHPTVGTAVVLAHIGQIECRGTFTDIVLEEGIGPVPVRLGGGTKPDSAQLSVAQLPEFGPAPPSTEAIAEVLGLDSTEIDDSGGGIRATSCGLAFLHVPVRRLRSFEKMRANPVGVDGLLRDHWARAIYAFTRETSMAATHVHARMFGGALGISEDPATGSAAAALAGVLHNDDRLGDGTHGWVIEQGIEMGRPSRIEVEVDVAGSALHAVRVGGNAVLVGEGKLTLPK